jgi:predicted porin
MSSSQAGSAIIVQRGGPALQNFEFNRRNVVAYKSPTMAGFVFSSSYGEDDIWDVALRYAGTWGDFKVAAGIAYGEASDNTASIGNVAPTTGVGGPDDRIQALNGGLSILHNPTGLFFTGSAGQQEFDGNVACNNSAGNNGNCDTEWFWMTNAGIQQKINPLGKTAFFGMVGEHKENDSATQYWGLGAVQQIDAAAMDLYISYKSYDIDPTLGNVDDRDFDAVVAGGRIKF